MKPSNKAKTVVLLRGLSREQRHWGDFIDVLQAHLPQYQILCLDTLGNGDLCHQASPLTISRYSQNILEQLAERQIQDAILVGLSLGGMVALAAMASGSKRVRQVIAINTSSRLSFIWKRFSILRVCKALLTASFFQGKNRLELAILQFTSHLHQHDTAIAHQWGQLREQKPTNIMNSIRQIIAAAKFAVPIQSLVDRPVSFIYSKQDKLVHPSCTMKLANILGAPTYAIDNAGHDIALDQPLALAEVLTVIIHQSAAD